MLCNSLGGKKKETFDVVRPRRFEGAGLAGIWGIVGFIPYLKILPEDSEGKGWPTR